MVKAKDAIAAARSDRHAIQRAGLHREAQALYTALMTDTLIEEV